LTRTVALGSCGKKILIRVEHRSQRWLTSLIFGAILFASIANAAEKPSREASLFDRPLSVQRVAPTSANGEIRCTYYADMMIRETGTDTPTPGPAFLVSLREQKSPCAAAATVNERRLETENHSFDGRKGAFLVFSATDPNGAIPFRVLDLADGHSVFSDARIGDSLQSIVLKGDTLRLRYRHGVNGSCSVYGSGPVCWGKLLSEGKVPRGLAQSQPSVESCGAAYRRTKAPANDPSLISYDVDVTLKRSGKARINSRGTVSCDAMP
jgi:hypothetical protein